MTTSLKSLCVNTKTPLCCQCLVSQPLLYPFWTQVIKLTTIPVSIVEHEPLLSTVVTYFILSERCIFFILHILYCHNPAFRLQHENKRWFWFDLLAIMKYWIKVVQEQISTIPKIQIPHTAYKQDTIWKYRNASNLVNNLVTNLSKPHAFLGSFTHQNLCHSFISLLPTNVKTHLPLHMTITYYDYVTR